MHPLHEAEDDGDNTHEASDTRNVETGGSTGRGGARASGRGTGAGRGAALTGRLGDLTSASELALDNVVAAGKRLEVGAVVGDVARRLEVEGTADVGKRRKGDAWVLLAYKSLAEHWAENAYLVKFP